MPNAPTTGLGVIVPEMLQRARQKVEERYATNFVLISIAGDWLNFRVATLTDECVIRDLEQSGPAIFGPDWSHLQVLVDQTHRDPGIFIQYLSGQKPFKHHSGAWYY